MIRRIALLLMNPVFANSCVDIAPDEIGDNDDTRIWLNEASSLDLDPSWFKEDKSILDSTILGYKQEFEPGIVSQVNGSRITIWLQHMILLQIPGNIYGTWHETRNGFRFIQAIGNQYPMTIYSDISYNRVKIENIK